MTNTDAILAEIMHEALRTAERQLIYAEEEVDSAETIFTRARNTLNATVEQRDMLLAQIKVLKEELGE